MDNKYIVLILILGIILGIILGYMICTFFTNTHVIKDTTITNPASW